MEHKTSCKGAHSDGQQRGHKEGLVHAFLTTRLIGLWNTLPIGGISLTWSIKAKSKFPGKRYVKKQFKDYIEFIKENCLCVNLFFITNIISYY